jgi:hypothetical protein
LDWFRCLRWLPSSLSGPDKRVFTDAFTPQEFTARRQGVMTAIGDGAAIISGAYDTATYTKFRQNAQFFYLTGVEVPRALLIIDGKTKTSTLFLPPHGGLERSEGPLLGPDDEAKKITGIEQVADRATFEKALQALSGSGRAIYMPFRGRVARRGHAGSCAVARHLDVAGSVGQAADQGRSLQSEGEGRHRHRTEGSRSHRRRPAHDQEPG